MGIEFKVCSEEEFKNYDGAKINYSEQVFENAIQIVPHGLLFEENIFPHQIEVADDGIWNKLFFLTSTSEIPFDIFSAAFYLLSRYEEYLPHEVDEHKRFAHQQSLAVKNNFIELPLVDVWAKQFKEIILQQFASIIHQQKVFKFLSTVDIDFAYKYNGIGLKRQVLKLGKSVLHLKFNDAVEQLLVMLGSKKDPYDTYDFIHKTIDNNRLSLQYFMLMKTGTAYDKNIMLHHPLMKSTIKKLMKNYSVGLHPSYYSMENKNVINEKLLLEKFTQQNTTQTRQHFLKFTLPQTYQLLESIGFTDDYTMAYSSISGFRASTSFPFLFFDLGKNQSSTILLHPTMVMDVTLKNSHQFTPQQAMQKIEQLINEVKKVNGTFISIWHNSSLCEDKEWKGWREVFEKLHTLASIKTQKQID